MEVTKSKKEMIRDWLLENAVTPDGNLNLQYLDFSEFDGNINISRMKVKKNIYQGNHKVQGYIYQGQHKVMGEIHQSEQQVRGNLYQSQQTVLGYLHVGQNKVAGIKQIDPKINEYVVVKEIKAKQPKDE